MSGSPRPEITLFAVPGCRSEMNSNSQSGSSAEVIDNSLDLVAFKRKDDLDSQPRFPIDGDLRRFGNTATKPVCGESLILGKSVIRHTHAPSHLRLYFPDLDPAA